MRVLIIMLIGLLAAWGAAPAGAHGDPPAAEIHTHADHGGTPVHGARCHEQARHAGCAASPAIIASHTPITEVARAVSARAPWFTAALTSARPDTPYRPPAGLA